MPKHPGKLSSHNLPKGKKEPAAKSGKKKTKWKRK